MDHTLVSPKTNLAAACCKIDQGARSFISAQVRLGGTQEVLDLDNNRNNQQSSTTEQFLSSVENADISQLVLELNNGQNVYQAALAVAGRLFQTSLLNYL